jgi:hypothetical protein
VLSEALNDRGEQRRSGVGLGGGEQHVEDLVSVYLICHLRGVARGGVTCNSIGREHGDGCRRIGIDRLARNGETPEIGGRRVGAGRRFGSVFEGRSIERSGTGSTNPSARWRSPV